MHRNARLHPLLPVLSALGLALGACSKEPEPTAAPQGKPTPAAAAPVQPVKAAPDAPNVLLITIDTLRTDRLGSYGCKTPTSPFLDALARNGARFTDVTAPTPKTWPSISTILTGLSPRTTNVRGQQRRIADRFETLAETFKNAGYRTGGVVANINLTRKFAYHQGFDSFVEAWEEPYRRLTQQTLPESGKEHLEVLTGGGAAREAQRLANAEMVTTKGLEWVATGDKKQPFFLWLHYMDPHGPYLPPKDYERMFTDVHAPEPMSDETYKVFPVYQRAKDAAGNVIKDMAHYRAQYDREIRYTDDQIRRLFEGLKKEKLDANMLTVVTADHGEAFGQHASYWCEHGAQPYQECAHVPLIVVQRAKVPAGRKFDPPVGLLDLAPTILQLAGLPVAKDMEGMSLAPLLRDHPQAKVPDFVFMESGYQDANPQVSVRHRKWKLIHVPTEEDRAKLQCPEYMVFDVVADPGETKDVYGDIQGTFIAQQMMDALAAWRAAHPIQAADEDALDPLDEGDMEMLRQAGYVGGKRDG